MRHSHGSGGLVAPLDAAVLAERHERASVRQRLVGVVVVGEHPLSELALVMEDCLERTQVAKSFSQAPFLSLLYFCKKVGVYPAMVYLALSLAVNQNESKYIMTSCKVCLCKVKLHNERVSLFEFLQQIHDPKGPRASMVNLFCDHTHHMSPLK